MLKYRLIQDNDIMTWVQDFAKYIRTMQNFRIIYVIGLIAHSLVNKGWGVKED